MVTMATSLSSIATEVLRPGLLISAQSLAEVQLVLNSGTRWLDLKDPLQGSLGRPSLDLVAEMLKLEIPRSVQVSVAGGELKDWLPSMNRDLAATLPARVYLKMALSDCQETDWQSLAEAISVSLLRRSQLILVHYADTSAARSPGWREILDAIKGMGGRYVLIDTFRKESGGLLDHLGADQLQGMIADARKMKLGIALAGSLKMEQLPILSKLSVDWLGVRGAVCKDAVRTGTICSDRLQQAVAMFPVCSPNGI